MTSKKKAGRNHKLTPEEVDSIISCYKEEKNIVGNVTYQGVYKYAQEKFKRENRLEDLPKVDFWRKKERLGYERIALANKINIETFITPDGKKKRTYNLADSIHKNFNDKNALLKALLPIQQELDELEKREQKLLEKNKKLTEDKKNLKSNNQDLQDAIYSLSRYIFNETGSETKELTKIALEKLWDNPLAFLNHYEKKLIEKENIEKKQKVVDLKKEQIRKLTDRF
ncbi:hypothetical protein [Metabacillus schmidteae]|uniref:hypothetical protein n=1 Tax=Metabacillus schmidteae TaxID=2730405 RepID=UPI00158DDAD6|nr:hypothetical protein [Metabacillus schmidteae]